MKTNKEIIKDIWEDIKDKLITIFLVIFVLSVVFIITIIFGLGITFIACFVDNYFSLSSALGIILTGFGIIIYFIILYIIIAFISNYIAQKVRLKEDKERREIERKEKGEDLL